MNTVRYARWAEDRDCLSGDYIVTCAARYCWAPGTSSTGSGNCGASDTTPNEQPNGPGMPKRKPDPWLAGCWRCGSDEQTEDDKGRVLCPPCRGIVTGSTENTGYRAPMIGRVFWESKALTSCWHCTSGDVHPDDELGLCEPCKAQLRLESA